MQNGLSKHSQTVLPIEFELNFFPKILKINLKVSKKALTSRKIHLKFTVVVIFTFNLGLTFDSFI